MTMDRGGDSSAGAEGRRLALQESDPAHDDFQYPEDLATAYWYSEIF